MLRLFWPYVVIYTAIIVFGVWVAIDENDVTAMLPVDIVVTLLSIAGMLIWRRSPSPARFATAWKAVVAVILVGTVVSVALDFGDLQKEYSFPGLMLFLLFVVVIELPAMVMNVQLALGRGASDRRQFTPASAPPRMPAARPR